MTDTKNETQTIENVEKIDTFELYRENNPIHLGNGEDFIPRLSTDPKHEIKPRLSTKSMV